MRGHDHTGVTVPDMDAGGDVLHRRARLQEGDVVRSVLGPQGHVHEGRARRQSARRHHADHHDPLRLRLQHRVVQLSIAGPASRPAQEQRRRRLSHRVLCRRHQGRRRLSAREEACGRMFGPVPIKEGPAAGQTILYFKAPWGLQMEAISYPDGMAYEKDSPVKLWDPEEARRVTKHVAPARTHSLRGRPRPRPRRERGGASAPVCSAQPRSARARAADVGPGDGALARDGGRLRLRRRPRLVRALRARRAGRHRRRGDGHARRAERTVAADWPRALCRGPLPVGADGAAGE